MDFFKTKIKFLIFPIIFFSVVFFSNYLFAYDETVVHPSLTEEMAKLYNENYTDNKLIADEIKSMKKGSTDEDKSVAFAIRSSNHFYNPLGVKGWIDDTAKKEIVPSQGMISKKWAHNSAEQSLFPGGDFTWERAIKDYANGDKARAYEGLGHILHLLEDATVPAHVRSDLHISPKELEAQKDTAAGKFFLDYEPYESWTGSEAVSGRLKFDFADKLNKENKKPNIRQSIDEYFDELAFYTNTGFFSKDTIYIYSEPNKKAFEDSEKIASGDIIKYVYGFDEYGQKFKLAKILENKSTKGKVYIVSDKTPEIHADYWSRLGSKAVLEGAGVIKLFKDEAEKAAKNSQTADQSWLMKNISKYFYALYGGILENGGTIVKNEVTLGTLLGNGAVYLASQATQAVKSSVVALYDWGKAATVAAYNAAKTALNTIYGGAKTTTVTVFNKTKTGLKLAKEYTFVSAEKIGDFFNSSANFVSQYFTSTAQAQLEFDVSKPLINSYSIEDILKQAKIIEDAQAATIIVPAYDAKLAALKNKKSVFAPGEEIALQAEIKNIGSVAWKGDKISLNVYVDMDLAKKFYHSSWLTAVRPADLGEAEVFPGEVKFFNFIVTAPQTEGDYFFRVRPVWQDEANEFSWLGEDIASWIISVQALKDEVVSSAPPFSPVSPADGSEEAGNKEIVSSIPIASPTPAPSSTPPVFYGGGGGGGSSGGGGGGGGGSSDPVPISSVAPTPTLVPEVSPTPTPIPEVSPTPIPSPTPVSTPDPTPIPDIIPPETSIVDFPENPTDKTTVNFRFSSSEPNSSFLCSLDGSEFEDCGEYTIFQDLDFGEYILKVKAKDEFGNIDETPSKYSWIIEKSLHLVISEIQIDGVTADDEFVEIYNPAKIPASLSGWSIQYRGGEATEYYKKNFSSDDSVPAQGYFLVARKDKYAGAVIPDMTWGAAFSEDGGTVFLSNNKIELTEETDKGEGVIDRIAWGQGRENYLRGEMKEFTPVPLSGQSLERKANFDSTSGSLSGGADKYLGNGWDSDDNSADFVLQAGPNPQNSKSFSEPRYAPEKISDFSAVGVEGNSRAVKLIWSAPNGANENLIYDIRFSDSEITLENFNSADIAENIPPVGKKSEPQELEIKNLALDKNYYFSIKTKDAAGLESEISFAQYLFLSAQDLSPWPTFKGNNQRTGQSRYAGSQSGVLKWKHWTGGWVINSPSISEDGNIYLWSNEGSESYGNLASLNSDGYLKWKQPFAYFENTPALDSEGNIIFAYHNMIQKNNWRDGDNFGYVWLENTYYGAAALSSVLVSRDDTIYYASRETVGYLYAIDSNLNEKWRKRLGGVIWGSPSEDKNGNIYANTIITAVKIDPETGADVLDKENSFFRLFSFDKNGNERWQKDLAGADNIYGALGFFSPAIGDEIGYIVAKNSLYAFELGSGEIKWNYVFTENNGASSPSLANDGTIYFVSSDGYLYAVDSEGAEKWRFRIAGNLPFWVNAYSKTSPAIGIDGTVYVSGENIFYAVNPDGTEKWNYPMPGDFSEQSFSGGIPAIGKNGEVYVSLSGSNGSVLFSFGDN